MRSTSTQQFAIGQRVIYNGCGAIETAVVQDIQTTVTGGNLPCIERLYLIAGDGWELGTTAENLSSAGDECGGEP